MPIPDHDHNGVLPPYLGNEWEATLQGSRAPWHASIPEVVQRFGTSARRRRILRGLLRLRAEIERLGLGPGFQWLDGSFLDIMSREPGDIDVVTFYFRPAGMTDEELEILTAQPESPFLGDGCKALYDCDAYGVDLSVPDTISLVESVHYWFGLFSHRRDRAWRGIVQVPLVTAEDADALALLDRRDADDKGT